MDLFDQTFKVYETLTPSKHTCHSEVYPLEQFNREKCDELIKEMVKLLNLLRVKFGDQDYSDEYNVWKWSEQITDDFHLALTHFAGDLFYFSDRWSGGRYQYISNFWEYKILPELQKGSFYGA